MAFKRKAVIVLLVGLVVVSVTGCAEAIQNTMNSWMGHGVAEVVASWGPPTFAQDIGGGQRALTWGFPYGSRTFIVDARGTIVSWSSRGLAPSP
jgi:hypothetical protein